ncbi:MAG: alkaline phosphatase family protein, partial [Candidatus Krumholzibacteria bacterium]|nr:alkaline phosphatase family protein [Candidatus Krumholzibacteria bacterium]
FQLYTTPININPRKPALPLSSEPAFYQKLSEKIGYFYTQGMPEDTKALEWGMFSDGEFVEQAEFVFQERLRMLDAILDDYDGGFLFFYFSSIDQVCHMLWRNMDPNHPGHNPDTAHYGDYVESLYVRMDSVLAVVQSRVPDDATIIAMSDHGFAPYYWKVHLNTWLYENGYTALKQPEAIGQYPLYYNVFWRRTRAFALGINGIYVNLRGREAQGVVKPGEEYDDLLDDISAKLVAYRDPVSGDQVVKQVYKGSEIYHGELAKDGPDLVIGYDSGYRASDRTAIGQLSETVITPNMDKWSGDHCMALDVVPGILVTNLPVTLDNPTLIDLSATILALYGIPPVPAMRGRVLFQQGKPGSP